MWTACRGAGGRAQAAPPRTPRGLQSRGRRAWPREAACVPPMRSWHAPRGRGQRGPLPGGRTHLHPPGRGRPCPSSDASWTCPLCRGQGGDGARAVTRGAPPSGAARGSPNPVARQQVRHIPQPSAATPPTTASLLGPRGWGLGAGDPAPRLPCLKNQESGRQRFRVARDRALGGRCVPAACRRPC